MAVATAAGADEWADVLSSSFVPLAVGSTSDRFVGSVDQRSIGSDLQLSVVTCGPSEVLRTERLARDARGNDLLFAIHLGGEGAVDQHGRTVNLIPGTAVMYDTTKPYQLRFPTTISELVLQMPRSAVRLNQSAVDAACARRIEGNNPMLRVLRAYSSEMLEVSGGLTPAEQGDLSRTAGELVASILNNAKGRVTPHDDTALFRRIVQSIYDNLGDPALTAQSVARAHHISVRYLYLLFEREGLTPAAYVRRERLLAARRELIAGGGTRQTVAGVAGRFGFNDVTTFTRAFRRQFGAAPLEWRLAAGA